MNNSNFPCKDCDFEFPTAKAFVNHIAKCVPYNSDASLQLQNAAILLRDLITSANTLANQEAVHKTRHAASVKKSVNTAWAWLKANKLQGDLK